MHNIEIMLANILISSGIAFAVAKMAFKQAVAEATEKTFNRVYERLDGIYKEMSEIKDGFQKDIATLRSKFHKDYISFEYCNTTHLAVNNTLQNMERKIDMLLERGLK